MQIIKKKSQIIKKKSQKLTKKQYMDKLYDLVYEGHFDDAIVLFKKIVQKYKISKQLATFIIASCGSDIHYDFVKPLVYLGGTFDKNHVLMAEYYLNEPKHFTKNYIERMPKRIEGYKLVLSEEKKKQQKK